MNIVGINSPKGAHILVQNLQDTGLCFRS